jgi:hypothetical protein
MHNIETIYLFIFVFTILVTLKHITKFIGALLKPTPTPMLYSNKELLYLGLSVSYIITYIIIQ